MEFETHRLDNGLSVVAECNGEAYSTALGFFVRAGSRDEDDAVAGVSHFLEHMTFKGTATRSADDVNREFDEIGAHYNAFTTEENTIYYAAVLPEYAGRAVELLADILRPALRESDFSTEKLVILEEIGMYEDQPPFGADERIKALHYGPHPLGRSVLGTTASITNLSAEAMRDYFRRRYSPENIVLVAAGQIDFSALVSWAERFCGEWAPLAAERLVRPAAALCGFEVIRKPSAAQEYVIQLADAPSAQDDDRYAARLLATVLGDDSGSRLYWELLDSGLAEQVGLAHYEFDGAGAMMTFMSCDPAFAADNLRRITEVYRTAEAGGITPEELEQAKSKVRSRIVLSAERPRGRLFSVGAEWLYRHRYLPVREELDCLAAVTCDEVAAVLAKYPLTRATTIAVGPLDELTA